MEDYQKKYLYKRIVKAKLFIDEHYTEAINLDKITQEAHFSKFHFIRLFKSIYGQTPNNYLIRLRLNKAKLLLTNGHSVIDTGMMLGLNSPTSFAGMFKKSTGKSPSAFQKEELAKKRAINKAPLQFVPNCFAEMQGWGKKQF